MIKHLKKLAGDSLIYGVSGILTRMLSIFLAPIYTRIFLPKDYGVLSLIGTFFGLIGIFAVLGMDSASARFYYDTKDIEDKKKTFGTWIWTQLMLTGAFALVIILLSSFLIHTFFKNDGHVIYLILPSIGLVGAVFPTVIINWYRVQNRPVSTVIFMITQTVVNIGLSVILVIVFHWGITGVFAATTITTTALSIAAMFQMRGWISFKYFDTKRLKAMMKFAFPLIPAALAYWLLNSTDSFFIAYFKNKSEVGLFNIGASLASIMTLITVSFQLAWGPFAYSILDQPSAKDVYANVFLLFGFFTGFLAACVMLFAPEILHLFVSPNYYGSAWVAGILTYNLVLISFTYIASLGISIAKTNAPYGIAMLCATLLTVLLDILFIPKWGKEGSALATVIAQLLVPIFLFYKSQKVYFIPYQFKKVAAGMLFMLAIAVTVRLINFESFAYQLTVKIIVAVAMLAIAALLNIKKIKEIIARFKQVNTDIQPDKDALLMNIEEEPASN